MANQIGDNAIVPRELVIGPKKGRSIQFRGGPAVIGGVFCILFGVAFALAALLYMLALIMGLVLPPGA